MSHFLLYHICICVLNVHDDDDIYNVRVGKNGPEKDEITFNDRIFISVFK